MSVFDAGRREGAGPKSMKRRTAQWAGAESGDGPGDTGENDRWDAEPSWERRLRHRDLGAVAEVRAALRHMLAAWGEPGRAGIAELLASELVTNALVHTDGPAVVTARLTGGGPSPATKGRLRVEVRDLVPRRPTLRVRIPDCDPTAEATSGRGLLLVHSLADAWGVQAHGVGKAVWFELDAQEP